MPGVISSCDNPGKHAQNLHEIWKCDTLALEQFGVPRRPGGECFAPCFEICVMAQKHIFQHCASARDFDAQMGDLESGEVMSRPNFMISENGPGSIQMHCKCIIITPHGP